MRERGNLSACLNMDKLHYFFQPSVQSSPFFPIILCVNEVAWVMMEKEKNTPLLPLKKKERERGRGKKSGLGRGMRIEFMYVEKAFLLEFVAGFWVGGKNKKRGNPKVNESDESISSVPDFHVNEVVVVGLFISSRPLGAFIIPFFDS